MSARVVAPQARFRERQRKRRRCVDGGLVNLASRRVYAAGSVERKDRGVAGVGCPNEISCQSARRPRQAVTDDRVKDQISINFGNAIGSAYFDVEPVEDRQLVRGDSGIRVGLLRQPALIPLCQRGRLAPLS